LLPGRIETNFATLRLDGILYMLLSVLLFTTANVLVKTIGYLPTTQIVFLRSVISLILCAGYVVYRGFPFFGVNRKWLIIRGVSGMIGLTLFFYTLQHIPLATATVIQYLSPVFTVLLALFYLQQKVRPVQWVFIAMALGGVIVVNGLDPDVPLRFVLIGVISAFFASVAYLATIKCKASDHPVLIVMYFHLLATPIMGGVSMLDWTPVSWPEVLTGLAVGVLSVIAQVAMAVAIMREDASLVTPFKYVGAAIAWGVGVVLFDEHIGVLGILGIAIVTSGVILNTLARRYRW
jgi:drug/metabolite transporter (DMT)-like permease